jgi:phosphate-selective porin OprO/OprP
MRVRRRLVLGFVALALGAPVRARAEEPGAPDADLRAAVEDLKREVAVLRRKLEVADEAQAAKGPSPVAGAGADGFYLRSADKSYEIKFRGYTNFDGRYYIEEDGSNVDTWLFRRVRPVLEGTLGGVVDFRLMPDISSSSFSLQDAQVNLRYFKLANLQAGKYKTPFGLERLQSATALMFVERALPTQLVPNRDLGLMLHGSVGEGLLHYQLAFMNGVVDGGSGDVDNGDGKDVIARVFGHPFQNRTEAWLSGLGLGVAFGYGAQDTGGTPATYRTAGQSAFFSYLNGTQLEGHRIRYSPQLYYHWGPFGLMGEYVSSTTGVARAGDDEEFENRAWQVSAGWVLTGESSSYTDVIPRQGFSLEKGTFGAFQVVARYNELKVDSDVFDQGFADPLTQAERARAWGVGLNWYQNRWIKLMFDYERTHFDGGGGTENADREDESVFFFRTQLAF